MSRLCALRRALDDRALGCVVGNDLTTPTFWMYSFKLRKVVRLSAPKHFDHILPFLQPDDLPHKIDLSAAEICDMHAADGDHIEMPVRRSTRPGRDTMHNSLDAEHTAPRLAGAPANTRQKEPSVALPSVAPVNTSSDDDSGRTRRIREDDSGEQLALQQLTLAEMPVPGAGKGIVAESPTGSTIERKGTSNQA